MGGRTACVPGVESRGESMPTFIAGLLLLYLLLAAIKRFGRMTPAEAAKLVRKGGVALGLAGLALTLLRGRFGVIGVLASALMGLAGKTGGGSVGGAFRDVGAGPRASSARSLWLDMRLDLDSGAVEGRVVAGPFAGRDLSSFDRTQALGLLSACRREDPDGARLLETYLDRRFAAWRDADQGQAEARGRRVEAGGAMSRDEAYEILGLPKGADREEVVRAHRSLMKKLHPDHGGSTALAARVNQAKDVLLDSHG